MVGINMASEPAILDTENVKACYTNRVGLGSIFLDYIVDGATGQHIGQECKDVYQYLVENFSP